jgi:hypothetical protein
LQFKRIRVLSSDDSPEKKVTESAAAARTVSNGYGFAGMPSPDIVQMRLDLLQQSFPNKVFYFKMLIKIFNAFVNHRLALFTDSNLKRV